MPNQDTTEHLHLLREINSAIELDDLLAVFSRELEKRKLFDGYLVNLTDINETNLICEKIRLPCGFENLETTMIKYRFPLDSDYVNAEAFKKNCVVSVNIEALKKYGEDVKSRFRLWNIQHLVAIPIPDPESGDSLGTVMAFRQGEKIGPDTIREAQNIINIFKSQIRNARIHNGLKNQQEEVNQTAADQQKFLSFISEINNLTSRDEIYKSISLEFLRQFDFDMSTVIMFENDKLVSKASMIIDDKFCNQRNRWDAFLSNTHFNISIAEGAPAVSFVNNTHVLFPDAMRLLTMPMSDKDREGMAALNTPRTFFLMPIRCNEKAIGVIWLISLAKTVHVCDTDISFIEQVCEFIGSAIKNSEIYDLVEKQTNKIEILNETLQEKAYELAKKASTDELTGLYNYSSFERELDKRIKDYRLDYEKLDLALIILDIDKFKRFNDDYGPTVGNAILTGVAQKLQELARENDIACRYGGEEFVFILPNCNIHGVRVFSERVRETIAQTTYETEVGQLAVTVSIGYGCHQEKEEREALFNRVDQALLKAKRNGRNRIEEAL